MMCSSLAALLALPLSGAAADRFLVDHPNIQAVSTLILRGIPASRPEERRFVTTDELQQIIQQKGPEMAGPAGQPKCDIHIYSLSYHTIGGHGEKATDSTAVMIPSGHDQACNSHNLPTVLVGRGTSVDKSYDMTNLDGDINGENDALASAAFFAAQGFITVVPNYAGYAGSSLNYAPYLNADQQAADMIDALRAARLTFVPVVESTFAGKLFVTGYSQGGSVAMATLREMQKHPIEFHPSAVATGSGAYAFSNLVDQEIDGAPSAISPLLFNLIINSFQNSYGNVYQTPGQVFTTQYASSAAGLLPGTIPQNTLFAQNALPENALFQTGSLPVARTSNPDTALSNALGFDPQNFYINTAYRDAMVADAKQHPCSDASGQPIADCRPENGLRQDVLRNDLLNFTPKLPVQLCGAHSDNLVYYTNTQIASAYFLKHGVPTDRLEVIDVDPGTAAPSGPFADLQTQFAASKAALAAQLGDTVQGQAELAASIHGLALPFCTKAARDFLQDELHKR